MIRVCQVVCRIVSPIGVLTVRNRYVIPERVFQDKNNCSGETSKQTDCQNTAKLRSVGLLASDTELYRRGQHVQAHKQLLECHSGTQRPRIMLRFINKPPPSRLTFSHSCYSQHKGFGVWGLGFGVWGLGDRKSTRLNSSHSQISYAVFCLKKKQT